MAEHSTRSGAVDLVEAGSSRALELSSDEYYRDYRKVLSFVAVWVAAVIIAVFQTDVPKVGNLWEHPGPKTGSAIPTASFCCSCRSPS